MTQPAPPPGPATATPLGVVGRLAALAIACGLAIALARGAAHLREVHLYAPTCSTVCAERGARYDGTTQYRKIDAAAACVCLTPSRDRLVVPTSFFSSVGILEFLAAFFSSTGGVLLGVGLVVLGVYAGVLARKKRSSAAP